MVLDDVFWVHAVKERVEVPTVEAAVEGPRSLGILLAWRRGLARRQVENDPDLGVLRELGAHRFPAPAVGQEQVVRGREGGLETLLARRVDTHEVSEHRHAPGLVVGDPELRPIPEAAGDGARVVHEEFARVARGPTACVLQRSRQVPVVERDHWLDPRAEEIVHELLIKPEALFVGSSASRGEHARPRHGEPVGVYAEAAHEVDVLGRPVVMITRFVAGGAVLDGARDPREGVPDGRFSPAFQRCALDLVSGGRDAPAKLGREVGHRQS